MVQMKPGMGLINQNLESIYNPNYDVDKKGLQPQMAFDAKGNLVQVGSYPNPKGYNFMSTPLGEATRGLVGDVERVAKYGIEGGKTLLNKGINAIGENVAIPISNFLADEQGRTPQLGAGLKIGTEEEIRAEMQKRDSTFDQPSLSTNAEESSLIGGWAKSTANFLAPYVQGIVDLPPLDPGVITDKFNKDVDAGKLTDASQSDVNTIINGTSKATNSTGEISAVSNLLTEAIGTKDDTKTDKLTGAINGFMDKLDTPGFQTALAMHMEAKNGGDVTSVLFEGMKVKKKAKQDALTAHVNNLKVAKAELEIVSLYQTLGAADKPSKELITAATSLFSGGDYDFGDQSASAAYAMSSLAMGIKKKNPGMDDFSALQLAISTVPEGTLKKDTWYSWGGSFDPSKLFTANTNTVSVPTPTDKNSLLKQLTASNPTISQEEIATYIAQTYPNLT